MLFRSPELQHNTTQLNSTYQKKNHNLNMNYTYTYPYMYMSSPTPSNQPTHTDKTQPPKKPAPSLKSDTVQCSTSLHTRVSPSRDGVEQVKTQSKYSTCSNMIPDRITRSHYIHVFTYSSIHAFMPELYLDFLTRLYPEIERSINTMYNVHF